MTQRGDIRGNLSFGNASSPDHSSGSKDNTHKEGSDKGVGTGQEQQSSGLSCDATSGQDHKHPDPTEMARHQPTEESGGSVAALEEGRPSSTARAPTRTLYATTAYEPYGPTPTGRPKGEESSGGSVDAVDRPQRPTALTTARHHQHQHNTPTYLYHSLHR